jgi:antitoxin MazE
MGARIVKIGNSQRIRIPKRLLEQTGIVEEFELEILKNQIIIHPVTSSREGWKEAFKAMAEKNDDRLIVDDNK